MREVRQRRTSGLSRKRQYDRQSKSELATSRHPADFNKKEGYALGILVLLIASGIFGVWLSGHDNPLTHSYSFNDPYTQIWHDAGSFSSEAGFTCISALSCHATTGNARLQLVPGGNNGLQAAVAITKNSIDLSTLSAKEALFQFTWSLSSTTTNVGKAFGWFLTTNSTLPTQNFYNPNNDKDIALYWQFITTNTADTYNSNVFINKQLGTTTLTQSDSVSCNPDSSVYFCMNVVTTHANGGVSGGLGLDANLFLNFTGQGSNTSSCSPNIQGGLLQDLKGPNCSWQAVTDNAAPSTNTTSSKIVPPLNFQSQPYYIGLFAEWNMFPSGTDGVFWFFDNPSSVLGLGNIAGLQSTKVMSIYSFIPASGSSTVAATDTGGWFGAVGRFLAPVGDFLSGTASAVWGAVSNPLSGLAGAFMNAINTAISLVSTAVVLVLNTIGNFFGLGNVGTDLSNFFSGIVNWLTNVFGGIIGQIGNIASGIGNGVTAIINIFTDFGTQAIGFLSTITGLPGLILTLWNDFLPAAYAISFVVLLWWLFGFYQAWRDWNSGDIVGFLMCIIMFGGVILILGSTTSINPIAANTTVQGIYAQGFTDISFLFLLLMPIFLVQVFSHWGSSQDRGDRTGHTTLQHWQSWAKTTEFFGVKLFHVSFIVAKESWTIIVSIKQLVAGWL